MIESKRRPTRAEWSHCYLSRGLQQWSPVAFMASWIILMTTGALTAGNGVLEINQACVASGCFPGDAPDFPVEITTEGSYILTGNLEVPDENTTAIMVTANNVTVNLNGFAIKGPLSCGVNPGNDCNPVPPGFGGHGIDGSGSSQFTVRNGSIEGIGGNGVNGGRSALISDIHVHSVGGIGIAAFDGIIRNCTVLRAKRDGINVFSESVVEGNQVLRNDEDGINCNGRCTIRDNVASVNGGDGIQINGNGTVIGNTLTSNLGFGLKLGPHVGWGLNVLQGNSGNDPDPGDQVSGSGVKIATNACSGAVCP